MTICNTKTINFNRIGYDPFVDFLKTYSILVVIFCHGFPYLKEIGYPIWGVQIPLFILIQVFHCYKREQRRISWGKIFRRILMPFIVVEIILFTLLYVIQDANNCKSLIIRGLNGGGYGPGSYYPWVYIQMALLIPFFRPIFEKLNRTQSFLVFLLLSVTVEYICSAIDLSDSIYRLLCWRYIFLIYLGYIWVNEGIKINQFTIGLSVFSLISIIIFGYMSDSFEQYFYKTGWKTHRMPCYFWTSFLFTGMLYWLFSKIRHLSAIASFIRKVGTASYEIFLMQMVYYTLISSDTFNYLDNGLFKYLTWILFAFIFSVSTGIMMKKVLGRFLS